MKCDNIQAAYGNDLLLAFATKAKEFDLNYESIIVGTHLLLTDNGILEQIENSNDLQNKIIELSKDNNDEYYGIYYNEKSFLDVNDEKYEKTDVGLDWVTFDELFNVIVEVESML